MAFIQDLKYILLITIACQCYGSSAFIALRSDEIPTVSGKTDEEPAWSLNISRKTQEVLMRTDDISIRNDDIKDMPEFRGGLLEGLLTDSERRKKHNPVRESPQEKSLPEDAYVLTASNRVRRADTGPQETESFNSFTDWESWSDCTSDSCTIRGIRTRHRSCFSFDSSSTRTQCTYENLVQQKGCYADRCGLPHDTRWSVWSDWGLCDVTCGKGGSQTRFRFCLHWNGTHIETKRGICGGTDREIRSCQYLSSCPIWDEWGAWSQCTESCGKGGMTERRRSCTYYRHDTTSSSDHFGTSLLDKFPESSDEIRDAVIHKIEGPTFVVDANEYIENATRFEKEVVKETVDPELCSVPGESNEEKKDCNMRGNCSSWTAWGAWSSCHRGCGPGFRKRERRCLKNLNKDPCVGGYKTQYVRCYPLPCWGPWTKVGVCSATCGKGIQNRTRRCKIYTHTSPYNQCQGEATDTVDCALPACHKGWSDWSPFTKCTVSCGRGFRFRNRTCLIGKCYNGLSRQAESCNRQRCPFWGQWGKLSCCNTTCGPGHASRTRVCIFGSNCRGKFIETHKCYSAPCDEAESATVKGLQCGIQSKSVLRRARLKIFNGKDAKAHAWPWIGSWQLRVNTNSNWKHFCAVSLLHPRWVITAAHCYVEATLLDPFTLELEVPSADSWSVLFGVSDYRDNGIRRYIYKIYNHQKYDKGKVAIHDISLIKLRTSVTFSETLSPICLPGTQMLENGEICVTAGWGRTEPTGEYSAMLQETSLPYVDFDDCRRIGDRYQDLSRDAHLCAGMTKGNISDTCEGDSGGPLACTDGSKWYLAGITSFSFVECGTPGNVGIYTRVTKYNKWIMETIQKSTYDNC